MGHREYVMQRIYDKLEAERAEEAAMDRKLVSDNAQLTQRLRLVK